ncbi:serine hydrolase [Streptomyces albus]|uniref:serine hydrolase n=1 Tax=Streptomyces sp. HPH0547 TaxID=1203592 RepID=UPI001F38F267|nr:serine hydrolase [Streptomyces sp. HPH0547]
MASGEQQHQEASVAGESPDRSERERSSGETTGSGGTVARPGETAENERLSGAAPEKGGTSTADPQGSSRIPAPTPPGEEAGGPDAAEGADEAAEADGSATHESGGTGGHGRSTGTGKGGDGPDARGKGGRAGNSDEAGKTGAGSAGDKSGTGGKADGADEGDARLKTAVAAWVAGDNGRTGGSDGEGKPAGGEGRGAGAPDAAEEAGRSGAADASRAKDAPRQAGDAAGSNGSSDTATAMFGIVRRGEGGAGKGGEEAAADRAERLTSAFFGSPKNGKGEPADGGRGTASGEGAAAATAGKKPAVDQPTAVFRAPDVSRAPKKPDTADGAGKPAEADKKESKGKAAAPQGGDKSAKTAKGQPEKSGTSEKDDAPGTSGRKGSATPDPRAATATAAPAGTDTGKGKPDADESDAERTSQFIPLRSADEPRTPARTLPPTAAAPTAPARPDAPPAPTANPWAAAPPRPAGSPGAQTQGAAEAEAERTRQQPMPGTPEAEAARQEPQPLDLLAQLTNSPPPPETPMRTVVRRVKIWTPLVLLLAVIFVVVQSVRPLPDPTLSLTARSTYTFDGAKPSMPWPSEGQAVIEVDGLGSFGTYGEQKPVPIASVAKVMTAYVVLRDHPVKKGTKGTMIPVDKKAEKEAGLSAQNESTVKVKAGTRISQREALNAIMIASANNVARLLGRWDAGSEKAFVKKMNAAAKDLGMTNTHYTDPSGLTASTVSTAADQVKLAKKVMEFPLFREVVRQPNYVDANGKTQPNWNRLVPLDGVVGIKTGTTTKAGGNLVFAAEKEIGGTRQLIVGAMLGQYKPSILDTVLANSKKLIDSAQDALTSRTVVKKGQVVGYVDDQLGGHTPVVATKDVTAVGWSGLKVKLALTGNGKPVPHEAAPGTKVGTLTAGDGPGQVRVPVAVKDELTEPGFGNKLTRVG